MKITIFVPINYTDVFRQTGVKSGKIAKRLGQWSVDNCPDASIACFTPPYQVGDVITDGIVTSVKIKDNNWALGIKER